MLINVVKKKGKTFLFAALWKKEVGPPFLFSFSARDGGKRNDIRGGRTCIRGGDAARAINLSLSFLVCFRSATQRRNGNLVRQEERGEKHREDLYFSTPGQSPTKKKKGLLDNESLLRKGRKNDATAGVLRFLCPFCRVSDARKGKGREIALAECFEERSAIRDSASTLSPDLDYLCRASVAKGGPACFALLQAKATHSFFSPLRPTVVVQAGGKKEVGEKKKETVQRRRTATLLFESVTLAAKAVSVTEEKKKDGRARG